MSDNQELRPVCFMVMPFRKKKVTGPTGDGAPNEIDCDALWDKAYRPAIEDAGYTPIRADFDAGMVIVIVLTTIIPPFTMKWFYKHYSHLLLESK